MIVADAVRHALEPYVGGMVADTCVRATALKLGKTADDLGEADLPELENNIRRLLSPVAPPAAIDDALQSLERAAREGGLL